MMDFSKKHAYFTLDYGRKSIKIISTILKDSKDKTKVTPSDVLVQKKKIDMKQLTA